MNIPRRVIDRCSVVRATFSAKHRVSEYLRLAELFANDPEQEARREQNLCVVCHYIKGRIGGAAMSFTQCGLCDGEMVCGNTCIDVICQDCAKTAMLCKHCGADLNLKDRRKKRPLVDKEGSQP